MCGIAGYFTLGNGAGALRAALPSAVQALKHRGPDDNGTWFAPGVGLGHARLSILDLSAHGHQPMVTADGRFAMVFNGEVYNYPDVRAELIGKGLSFAGTGDSEVVLAALATWGLEAVKRFIGMFSIAFWDNQKRTLSLIRDRLGVKPLYYGWDGQTLWFGSELKALRAFPHWQPEIDRVALGDYFQFGYITAPLSIYKAVKKVQPGYWVTLGPANEPREERYWSVLDAISNPLQGSEADLEQELETLLEDAFNLRMVSDVPVGVFLSGGIDSSLLAALLQKRRRHDPIHTFTIGFNESRSDESVHARRVAEHLGTIHSECILSPNDAKAILPSWAKLYDEPFADSSGIPTYLVSRMASEKVKVVLSADGGDELFSGYSIYDSVLAHWKRRNETPAFVRYAASAILGSAPSKLVDSVIDTFPMSPSRYGWLKDKASWKVERILDWVDAKTPGMLFENMLSFYSPREIASLLGRHDRYRPYAEQYPGSVADQLGLWDLHHYLPGDILAKVDRATMAVSIEGREPLIDHRVAEFAFRLPLSMRRGALGPKHVLKKLLHNYVPREMVDRPKKGFSIPLLEWLKGDLHHLVDQYLNSDRIRAEGILDDAFVQRVVRNFNKGQEKLVNKVWVLIAFQMWREEWS